MVCLCHSGKRHRFTESALSLAGFSLEPGVDFYDRMGKSIKRIYDAVDIFPCKYLEDISAGNPGAGGNYFVVSSVSETGKGGTEWISRLCVKRFVRRSVQ